MKASELIMELEKVKDKHGDFEVCLFDALMQDLDEVTCLTVLEDEEVVLVEGGAFS